MTGKSITFEVLGRKLHFYNQRCKDWTHPYEWNGEGNLADSGCGIFSVCHCMEWLAGSPENPESWADFAVREGGRGDDGTNRPDLLAAMQLTGEAARHGFYYAGEGLMNDKEKVFKLILQNRAVAMCNLRPGHIVSLVSARVLNDSNELLAIDSYSESSSEKVRDHVTETVPGSEIFWQVVNSSRLVTGASMSYGAFWVTADCIRDITLLHRL